MLRVCHVAYSGPWPPPLRAREWLFALPAIRPWLQLVCFLPTTFMLTALGVKTMPHGRLSPEAQTIVVTCTVC
jgi:hypothetical protein